ncbi:MAG: SAM-dependent methyltransferase [Candidatus Hydrogenedentota bacterium]
MKLSHVLLFAIIIIPLIPLVLLGAIWATYKQIFISRKLGISATGADMLNSRWIMHITGQRDDEYTYALLAVLPNASRAALWATMFPVWLNYRLTGHVHGSLSVPPEGHESIATFIYGRTIFFDELFERHLDTMEQVVFLGAGCDTRAFKFCQRDGLSVFELDRAKTQQVKIEALGRAGLNSDFITFVPVDFADKQWHERLLESGFDSNKKTLFLWEGVTLYLYEADVLASLQSIATIGAPGSILACDIYDDSFLATAKKGEWILKLTKETLHYSLDLKTDPRTTIGTLLNDADLSLQHVHLGGEATKKGTMVALIEASIP